MKTELILVKCMGLNIQRGTQIQNTDAPWQEKELRAYYTSCGKDGGVSFFSKFIMGQEWDLVVSLLLPIMQVSPVSWVPPCPLFQALPYRSPPLPLISPTSPSLSQFSSVTQSCPTLCDPMNHSTPGLPVHHQLPEFTQTHIH